MTSPQQRFLAQRAALRKQLEQELAGLHQEALAGEMSPDDLRARLNSIFSRYLGETPDDLRSETEQVVREYAELHDAQQRLEFLEGLQRMLGN